MAAGPALALALAALLALPAAAPVQDPAADGAPPIDRAVVGFAGPIPGDAAGRVAAAGGAVAGRIDALGALMVRAPDPDAFAAAMRAQPGVRHAARDGVAWAQGQPLAPNPPGDPLYPQLWHLEAIRAPAAWALEGGAPEVVVAVLDTGMVAAHPDLREACVPGCAMAAWDGYGHGTHVAGLVAASANNGEGVVGVAPGARLLGVKALHDAGWGLWSQVAAGIVLAADAGARVIGMSLGGACQGQPEGCALLEDAVAYAQAKGALLVAASGNAYASCGCVLAPASMPGVLAVGALDPADAVPAWSGKGAELDLVAPGVQVWSTMSPASRLGVWGCSQGWYCARDGTSAATPLVAGAASLVMSRCPALTAPEVQALLAATARDLGAPGWDPLHGHGLLDAGAAVAAAC